MRCLTFFSIGFAIILAIVPCVSSAQSVSQQYAQSVAYKSKMGKGLQCLLLRGGATGCPPAYKDQIILREGLPPILRVVMIHFSSERLAELRAQGYPFNYIGANIATAKLNQSQIIPILRLPYIERMELGGYLEPDDYRF
jgi:hypothetical protein